MNESYARAAGALRRWFEDGFERLGGPFHEAAMRAGPGELAVGNRLKTRTPGLMSIRLLTRLSDDVEYDRYDPSVTYSREAWEDFLLTLGRVPVLASLDLEANDNAGGPDGPGLAFGAVRVEGDGTWICLDLRESGKFAGPGPRRVALLEFLREVAEEANPVHGEISWGNSFISCVYEEATHSRPEDTLPRGRQALRGYAWLTILPEEIGVRLGGVEALRASGAFVEVERLESGGFWCRVTEELEAYDQAAAERVFEVVAPVLPPGRPDMWHVYPPNVLSPRDPASFSQSGR
ncbi:hypothetical protein [Polymorphospora sp. NPDC050346]|uniref:hypothetical protein n=1 Tax=Polymorphospora sp. NPDC050346 TaxID=3155780 RepID=UPI0033E7CF1E